MSDLEYAYVGNIIKYDEQPDGTLMVYGKMTGPDLDHDRQRCDPGWLKTAVPDWFEWANVREQHGNVVAGVGKELTQDGSDYYLKSHVIDSNTVAKVKGGALKGYSIGIKNGRILKTADAPEGLIKAGIIAEVSLVDRPSNPTCGINIAKSAGGGTELSPVETEGAEFMITEGGNVVTETTEEDPLGELGADAHREMEAVTAAAELAPLTVKAYRDALRLVEDVLTGVVINKAQAADGTVDESADIAAAHGVIAQIADLIISEAAELKTGRLAELRDIEVLASAVRAMCQFIDNESGEHGGEPGAYGGDEDKAYMADVDMALQPDLLKEKYSADQKRQMLAQGHAMRNPQGDPSYPIGDEDDLSNAIHAVGRGGGSHAAIRSYIKRRARAMGKLDLIPSDWLAGSGDVPDKAVTADDDGATIDIQGVIQKALTEATAPLEAELAALRGELAKVKSVPVPAGPLTKAISTSSPQAIAPAAQHRAQQLRNTADGITHPAVAAAYRDLAAQIASGEKTS